MVQDKIRDIQIHNSVKSRISQITRSVKSNRSNAKSQASVHSRYQSSHKKKDYREHEEKAGNEIMVWGSNNYG